MNLLDRFLQLFDRRSNSTSAPSSLRNKPGGMAWINPIVDAGDGAHVLVNRIVCTQRLTHSGFWVIDPPQRYVLTCPTRFSNGFLFPKGETVVIGAISDRALTPIPDTGITTEEVTALYTTNVKEGQTA